MNYAGSSNVRSATYNEKKKELKVRFIGNRQYVFSDVPKTIFTGLEKAKSKGSFVHRKINGSFDHRRVK